MAKYRMRSYQPNHRYWVAVVQKRFLGIYGDCLSTLETAKTRDEAERLALKNLYHHRQEKKTKLDI